MTLERALEILGDYINYDVMGSEQSYVRDMLRDVCECTWDEIVELGMDYLWPGGKDEYGPITPEGFAKKMKDILDSNEDPKKFHEEAVALMVSTLVDIGYGEGIDVYMLY